MSARAATRARRTAARPKSRSIRPLRPATPTFVDRVLTAVKRIPAGRVATYGDIAALAGRPGAARAVGTVMRRCRERGVPCHRVVAAAGRLGGFGGEPGLKRSLLLAEGILVRGTLIRDFATRRWTAPRSPDPGPHPPATRRRRAPV